MHDARLDAEGLSDPDLETLRVFGVRGGLATPRWGTSPHEVADATERFLLEQVPRLARAGLEVVTSAAVPLWLEGRRGQGALLDALPRTLGLRGVAAVGPLEWTTGSRAQQELLLAQAALADALSRPVVVSAPRAGHEPLTARLLACLARSKLSPAQVLVDGVTPTTVRSVLARGHHAGLSLHPERLGVDLAERLVHSLGPERLVLATGGRDAPTDLLALPRLISRLKQARLSGAVIRRVGGQTLWRFLGQRG